MLKARSIVFASLPLLAFAAGCGNETVTFNDNMIKVIDDLRSVGESFGKTIRAEKDPGKLNTAHAALVTKVNAIVAEANKIKVPEHKEAKEFWRAFQALLSNQEKMLNSDCKELTAAASTGDKGKMMTIMDRFLQVEANDLKRFHEAQGAFAKANNLKIR